MNSWPFVIRFIEDVNLLFHRVGELMYVKEKEKNSSTEQKYRTSRICSYAGGIIGETTVWTDNNIPRSEQGDLWQYLLCNLVLLLNELCDET